jgi:hypothetical protein
MQKTGVTKTVDRKQAAMASEFRNWVRTESQFMYGVFATVGTSCTERCIDRPPQGWQIRETNTYTVAMETDTDREDSATRYYHSNTSKNEWH